MNESLADFSKIGKVNYNRDPLEFIHSMKDNTISGLDYVSVFGAGTSNSEFEAMTGNFSQVDVMFISNLCTTQHIRFHSI